MAEANAGMEMVGMVEGTATVGMVAVVGMVMVGELVESRRGVVVVVVVEEEEA